MPTRAHRPPLTRTHSRSSSGGGSSKVGLNLQITQKDAPPPTLARDKSKQYLRHEPAARTTFSRTGSAHHLPTREREQVPYPRRPPPPQALAPTKQGGKPKADFRISSPSDGDDDEEWVSSESGAATPSGSTDSEGEETTTPVEPQKPFPVQSGRASGKESPVQALLDPPTPRAETPRLPRIDTVRQQPLSPLAVRDYAPAPRPQQPPQQQQREQRPPQPPQPQRTPSSQGHDPRRPQGEASPVIQEQGHPMPPVQRARSETHSPPRKSSPELKRQSMTRPPSTHSVTRADPPLRPHPLIRGHSYGAGVVLSKPTALAPLAVSSEAAQAEMSGVASPSSLRADSPTSIKTMSAVSPQLSTSSSQASKQLRRTSVSSAHSPLPPSISSSKHDRQRTLSTMSSSSSFAALSHLNLGSIRGTPSPPRPHERPHITAHFPPAEQSAALESIHPLLPPPYLMAHLTVLQYRNPIAESYDRVTRAKQRR